MSNSLFGVFIVKRDKNVITVVQTGNYDEASKAWDELTDQWTKCILDKKPFILSNNVNKSAFDPGLIEEIMLKTVELTNRINPNNPFMQEMQRSGFSNTFGSYTQQSSTNSYTAEELLDRGFNY
jgi:hypothetical protein